jgi:hypothetical protein
MKTIATPFILFCAFALMLLPGLSPAQSIVVNSVSGMSFCAGDPLSVTIAVTGTWGHLNAFTLQLSNTSGTFDNGWTKLGSVIDTAPGSFTISTTIPPTTLYSSHYRLRVIGAKPYTESSDNGSDILIGQQPRRPNQFEKPSVHELAAAVGVPIRFHQLEQFVLTSSDTVHIDYGAGATVSSDGITYSSSGLKTIILESIAAGGCSVIDTFHINAYGCDNPVIPHNAIILSSDVVFTDNNQSYKTFWLNPGVSLTLGSNANDTIFAEAGSSVSGQNGGQSDDIVYLKKGAASDPDFYGVVVYQPGASVTNTNSQSIRTVECPDLVFDYSVAPPNSIMHINDGSAGVAIANTALEQIALSPNPTNGNITINGLPQNITDISVMNLLGATEMKIAKPNSSDLQVNLGKLSPGVYYVRFVMSGAVVTKKIVKE